MGDCEGCVTPWDVQSKRVNTPNGTSPTLCNNEGRGVKGNQPIVTTTANTNANGSNFNQDGVSYTLDGTNSNAVAFAQNTRDEVRLFGGDGQTVGALAAQPGMKQTSYVCMQDSQCAAQFGRPIWTAYCPICESRFYAEEDMRRDGFGEMECPSCGYLVGWKRMQGPATQFENIACMESAQAHSVIEMDQAPTINASHEQPIVCAADDNGKTAVEENLCGSLKVGGGSP